MLRDDAEKFKNETKDIVESGDLNEELRGNEAKLTYKLQDGNLQEDEIKNINPIEHNTKTILLRTR